MGPERRRWVLVSAVSLAVHGLAAVVVFLSWSEPREAEGLPPLSVALIEEAREPSSAAPAPEAAGPPVEPSVPIRRRPRRAAPEVALPRMELEEPEPPVLPEAIEDGPLPGIDPVPSVGLLMEIAGADPRVRRAVRDRERPSIFERARLRRHDLPRELEYARIRAIIDATWNPDFADIKDESISEVSLPWVRRGLRNWLTSWQEELARQGAGGQPLPDDDPWAATFARVNPEAASDAVFVELDLEPLLDGSWAVSIATPSDHPFFDRRALESAREASGVFPPWIEGYGSALRYRLDAKFVIVPPSLNTLFGLSCAFPFCTPEELAELEVYYWFKKLVNKHVHFEGLAEAPPRRDRADPDAGPSNGGQRMVDAD